MWQEFLQRLASGGAEFTYDGVSSWGDKALKTMTSLGLLHEAALATHVVCDSCPEAHWEKVRWSTDGTRAFIPCPIEGAVNVDRDRLRRWEMVPLGLAELLARAMNLSGRVESFPDHRAWYMGERLLAGRNRHFFFAAIGPDELPSTVKDIQDEHGRVTGALLLPFAAPNTDGEKLRFIHMSNVSTLKGRQIAVNVSYIEEQFIGSRRVHPEKPEARGSAKKLAIHRRTILLAYMNKRRLDGMKFLAMHLDVSPSALYGMARGDRHRYSEGKLSVVLNKIGCTREQWNRPTPSSLPK